MENKFLIFLFYFNTLAIFWIFRLKTDMRREISTLCRCVIGRLLKKSYKYKNVDISPKESVGAHEAKFLVPDWGTPGYIGWRAGTTTLCQSRQNLRSGTK